MNDQSLITRVLIYDDQHAFTTLVKKHQQPIRQFLRRLTNGNYALADDLAQQVFIAAYNKLSTFKAASTFSTWLHSIAYRRFLNEMRKEQYQSEIKIEDEALFHSTENPIERTIENSVENEILAEQLVARLSETERACITLAFSAGMSHQEIVTITGLPLGTVKSHINRSKQKLSNWLTGSLPRSTL